MPLLRRRVSNVGASSETVSAHMKDGAMRGSAINNNIKQSPRECVQAIILSNLDQTAIP